MVLPTNISLKLKDGWWVDRVLFSLSPDLSPLCSTTVAGQDGRQHCLRGEGVEVWEEGWLRGPHCSLPKAVTLILEQVVDDGDTHVAWVSCRLESSEGTFGWSAEGTCRISKGFYSGIYTGIT